MQRRTVGIAMVLVGGYAAADSKPAGSSTYELSIVADQPEPPHVTATITWPTGYTLLEQKHAHPTMRIPGAEESMELAALFLLPCRDKLRGMACIDEIVSRVHPKAERTLVGKRLWIRSKISRLSYGSLFVYHPATNTVVECQTKVRDEHVAKLVAARKACEGLSLK